TYHLPSSPLTMPILNGRSRVSANAHSAPVYGNFRRSGSKSSGCGRGRLRRLQNSSNCRFVTQVRNAGEVMSYASWYWSAFTWPTKVAKIGIGGGGETHPRHPPKRSEPTNKDNTASVVRHGCGIIKRTPAGRR